MRLTLRTMLAYMDDILEPEQAQDLGKKIEESDFATNLMVRIRDVTRRLRLGAPNLGERGAVFDPNTVAEYLDNTLAGDRVPDFEKVCLESDVHLAEVASCHQILTMVLGEPAEVDPEGRQRMYQLPTLPATEAKAVPEASGPAKASTGGDGAVAGTRPSTTPPPRPKAGVPDYLREPPKKRRFWPVAATLFLAGFVTVLVLAAFGQFDPGKPLARLLGIRAPDEVAAGPDQSEPSPETGDVSQPGDKPSGELEQPKGIQPKPPEEAAKTPAEKAPLPEDLQPTPPDEKPSPEKPGEMPGPVAPLPPDEKPSIGAKPDTVDPTVKPATEKPGEAVAESPVPKPPEPAPLPEQLLGRLLSDREVLLRLDPKDGAWGRIPPQGNVSSGQELLALPTFRPIIGLSAGITMTLTGGTQIELLPSGNQGVPGLAIAYGRVLLSTVGKPGTQIRVQSGNVSGTVTLTDPDSSVALAISRSHTPGADPETQLDPVRAEIYALNGRIDWTAADGAQPVTVNAPALLTIQAQAIALPVPVTKPPEWVSADTASLLDRRASPELERVIVAERPVRISLLELLDHRQREVKWLAARCLGYLGEYQLMVAGLNSDMERLVWPDYIDQLQEAVLRGPVAAAAVRQTMEKQFGQEGAALYRMLLGYSEAGLKAGDAAALVDFLEHKDLAFRVLSFWNLRNITGLGLFYQPEAPKIRRDPSVKKWRERLAAGTILPGKEPAGAAKPASEGPSAKPAPVETPPDDKPVALKPPAAKPAVGLEPGPALP